jgi:peptidoglycan/xylan/chitin deacetylase (PgdA/CDA1 family)
MTRNRRPIVLCYHAISSSWVDTLAVSPTAIEAQLRTFKAGGYVSFTFGEAERLRRTGDLPAKALVITFDDAYRSVLEVRPILKALGFAATIFPVADYLDGPRLLTWPGIEHWLETPHRGELVCLSAVELLELQGDGWEIGSHTMSHARLTDLDNAACLGELVQSRKRISECFGSCETVAYPYGVANERVARCAAAAGYLAGCTGGYAHRIDEPHLRPRLVVSGTDGGLRRWAKMSRPGRTLRRTRIAELIRRPPGPAPHRWTSAAE